MNSEHNVHDKYYEHVKYIYTKFKIEYNNDEILTIQNCQYIQNRRIFVLSILTLYINMGEE